MQYITEILNRDSLIKVTKQEKIYKLAHALAIRDAKKTKDPLYDKFSRARKLMLLIKAQIIKKYGNRAMLEAREIAKNVSAIH